ncbi:hypothetical protein SGRIM128S_05103 [Streptomyces griseomycini]
MKTSARAFPLLLAALLPLSACGIPETGVVEAGEPATGVLDPGVTSVPSESVPEAVPLVTIPLYFVEDGSLAAVDRTVPGSTDLGSTLLMLFKGPDAKERGRGLTTELPPAAEAPHHPHRRHRRQRPAAAERGESQRHGRRPTGLHRRRRPAAPGPGTGERAGDRRAARRPAGRPLQRGLPARPGRPQDPPGPGDRRHRGGPRHRREQGAPAADGSPAAPDPVAPGGPSAGHQAAAWRGPGSEPGGPGYSPPHGGGQKDRVAAPVHRLGSGPNRTLGRALVRWATTTDHKVIGSLYMATSFGFFLFGGAWPC